MNILGCAVAAGESRVVGLCDVDQRYLGPATEEINRLTGETPRKYDDYRELLQKEKPEIVIVATPDHWHALNAIAAVDAGAHVYLEKPISHTINEGRAIVNAARNNDRVVQVGTHRRMGPHNISAMEFLRSGKVGDIGMVRAFVHSPFRNFRGRNPQAPPSPAVPEGLNWDMWCGPAPYTDFNRRIHPRGFRQFLNYANGVLGDWGIHWLDQILWWSEEQYPKEVYSTGGRFVVEGITDAPDTQTAVYKFDSFTVEWEHRLYAGNNAEKHSIGCYFYGTKGTLHLGWLDGWSFYPGRTEEASIPAPKIEPSVHVEPQLHEPDQQNIPELWLDFLESIKAGRRPVCDVEIGHRSTAMSLLGMLSYRLGRSIKWDGQREQVLDDPEANRLLSREYRAPWVYPKV
jgi:predicted dehydrogenase